METRRDSLGSQIGWKRFLAATCSASDVSAFCLSKPLPVFCCLSNGRQMKWSEETWFFTRWAFRSFTSSSREKNRSETFPPTRERGNCLFPDWARQNWLKRRWRETTAIKTTKTTLSKSFLLRRQDAITHSLVRPSVRWKFAQNWNQFFASRFYDDVNKIKNSKSNRAINAFYRNASDLNNCPIHAHFIGRSSISHFSLHLPYRVVNFL